MLQHGLRADGNHPPRTGRARKIKQNGRFYRKRLLATLCDKVLWLGFLLYPSLAALWDFFLPPALLLYSFQWDKKEKTLTHYKHPYIVGKWK